LIPARLEKARRAAKFIYEVYDIEHSGNLFIVDEDEFKLSYSDFQFVDYDQVKETFNTENESYSEREYAIH
jgi:hypothetical protein